MIRSYAIGHDMLAQYEAGTPAEGAYILADGHGSTRQLTDASAAVTAVYGYDAYGVSLLADSDATQSTSLQFSGEQTDALTGLQYLRARYYDATTGRFNRRDPFAGNHRDPQSLHKYMYCHGDPVNGVDPSGMMLGALLSGVARAGVWAMNAGAALQAKGFALAAAGALSYLAGATTMAMMSLMDIDDPIGRDVAMVAQNAGLGMMGVGGAMMIGGFGLKLMGAVMLTASTVTHAAYVAPDLGRKLDYMYGMGKGNLHNVQRSNDLMRQLYRIGLPDTPANRQYLTGVLTKTLRDPNNILRAQTNGRIVRDTLLVGPHGCAQMETVWEGEKLITVMIFGK